MKNTVHYILILDQSGALEYLKREVIFSFNEQVDAIINPSNLESETVIKLTLCVLNDSVQFKFIEQSLDRIKKLSLEDYQPDSFTAIYNAIGPSFVRISELIEPGDQVFFAVFSDGLEKVAMVYTA